MHMNRFFAFLALLMVTGCVSEPVQQTNWFSEYGTLETGTPIQMQYGSPDMQPGDPSDNLIGAPVHRMAVLLPLSGNAASTGQSIRTSIEAAVLQNAPMNLSVAFYDTSSNITDAINTVLSDNPEVIIGPVFSSDVRALRNAKPEDMPVLSFTSDAASIGDGVMTMALMPTNGVEAIVKEMSLDGIKSFIILAPDTLSGKLMAGAAVEASEIYNVPTKGIFYYKEKNSESIKNTTIAASMNAARAAANTRAREILSDILVSERLTALEKSSLTLQLERMSKLETIGSLPYDAVLFLGNGDDAESLASFLRYYGVSSKEAKFYGTTLWEGSDIANDFTMIGAKYAALPDTAPEFVNLYERISNSKPNHLSGFGYDAANMAMGMIYSPKTDAAYLLDPSGYAGVEGLYRLKPTGENERALNIVQLTGNGATEIVREANKNFLTPIYNIEQTKVKPANAMDLETPGINPNDYISIPQRLQSKYKSKTYGAHITRAPITQPQQVESIVILPEDDSDPVVTSPDFQPITLESVDRSYIDSIEIEE